MHVKYASRHALYPVPNVWDWAAVMVVAARDAVAARDILVLLRTRAVADAARAEIAPSGRDAVPIAVRAVATARGVSDVTAAREDCDVVRTLGAVDVAREPSVVARADTLAAREVPVRASVTAPVFVFAFDCLGVAVASRTAASAMPNHAMYAAIKMVVRLTSLYPCNAMIAKL